MSRLQQFFVLFAIASLSIIQLGCGSDAQSKPPTEDEEEETPALPVEASVARLGDISAVYTGTATLEAEQEAAVVAKAGGVVTSINAEEGQYVREGDVLVKLDDERLALEVRRAEAALARLEREFERARELHELQLISSEEFETARSAYDGQKAATELAELNLRHTTVLAPISGVVSERMVKVGNMIQTNESTYRITSFNPLLAVMHVPERELSKMKVGQPAQLRFDALAGETFRGRIDRISPVVDPATGTFRVTVEVANGGRQLKPGMFARIGIVYDTRSQALLVPKEAVITEDDESAIFVVRGDTAYRRIVGRGYENALLVEIQGDVRDGEQVIVTGQANLRDSSRVAVIQ